MPNWVFCNLSVTGEKSAVEAFDAEMRKPYPVFTYPEGQENRGYGHLEGKWQMSEGGEFSFWNALAPTDLEAYFTGDTWYGWNTANWGCKWDAKVEDEDTFTHSTGEEQRTYRFDTAWSPPTGVFVALCAKYTNLSLSLSYEEEQGWGGELESDDEGGVVETESYDIPDSHADYVKRDREDSCNCAWADDESDWYDDCPREEEDESKTIIVTDLTSLVVS
jgi:hypothetical protein